MFFQMMSCLEYSTQASATKVRVLRVINIMLKDATRGKFPWLNCYAIGTLMLYYTLIKSIIYLEVSILYATNITYVIITGIFN